MKTMKYKNGGKKKKPISAAQNAADDLGYKSIEEHKKAKDRTLPRNHPINVAHRKYKDRGPISAALNAALDLGYSSVAEYNQAVKDGADPTKFKSSKKSKPKKKFKYSKKFDYSKKKTGGFIDTFLEPNIESID